MRGKISQKRDDVIWDQ